MLACKVLDAVDVGIVLHGKRASGCRVCGERARGCGKRASACCQRRDTLGTFLLINFSHFPIYLLPSGLTRRARGCGKRARGGCSDVDPCVPYPLPGCAFFFTVFATPLNLSPQHDLAIGPHRALPALYLVGEGNDVVAPAYVMAARKNELPFP